MTGQSNIGSAGSSEGIVLARATANKFGQTVTAELNGVVTTINTARDLTVVTNDVLMVSRIGSQWFAIGRVWAGPVTPPADNEAPPDPQPDVVTGTLVVSPVETRSYRNGAWRTDNTLVYQGEFAGAGNHTGAVFFGNGPKSLAGATVTSATVYVKRVDGGIYAAQNTTMRLMTNSTRPAGAPTLTSTSAGPALATNATNAAFALPTAWVQEMVDSTAGGIAFFDADGEPYVKFAGKNELASAWTMTINWQRG